MLVIVGAPMLDRCFAAGAGSDGLCQAHGCSRAMGKINRLPPDLANQIAAGEVVERPASVVKELVENAIDAGARRLAIHVELGGKKQVRVEDDGEGMDAGRRAAGDRAARDEQDPARRRSGGDPDARLPRRGAAVDRVGVALRAAHARARARRAAPRFASTAAPSRRSSRSAAPQGTVVEVDDLFYNLPARRKFLKSDGAESAQVSRIVTQLALAYPEVGFTLTSAGRKVLQCPPAASLRDRLYQVYGERADLMEVRKEAGGIEADRLRRRAGRAGADARPAERLHQPPHRQGPDDRARDHRRLQQASIKERSPEVHLFIEMPPDAVDVNVHPTKAEVRFREQSLVHEVVRRALMDALGAGRRAAAAAAARARGADAVRRDAPGRAGGRRVSEPLDAGRGRRLRSRDARGAARPSLEHLEQLANSEPSSSWRSGAPA